MSRRIQPLWTVALARFSLMRVARGLLRFAAMAGLMATSVRGAEEAPDLDFLAYLGSWQENDEEWLAVSEWEDDEEETAQAPPEERKDDEKET